MKNKLRKVLALTLTAVMLLTTLPLTALAEIITEASQSGQWLRAVVVEPDTDIYVTFEFTVNGTVVDTQIVNQTAGESVSAPATPAVPEGKRFDGWFMFLGAVPFTPGVVSGFTASTTVTVNAQFTDVYYVYFRNTENVVIATRQGATGETIQTSDVTFPVAADESITGWYTEPELTNNVSPYTVGSSDVSLYAKVEKGHWLSFDSKGGTYIEPVFYPANVATVAPAVPTREGYTFAGWYTNATTTTAAVFGGLMAADATYYAKWTPNTTTPYTVIHWQQNADDDKYSFSDYEKKTGVTGATTAAVAKSYSGFTPKTITQVSIAGDGSTIVNVYYDRNIYSVSFYRYQDGWSELTALRITAKYGANISSQWPTSTSQIWGTKQGKRTGESPYQSGIDVMPLGGDMFYYVDSSGSYTMNLYYYTEVLDGTTGTVTYNGAKYILDHTDSFKSNSTEWSTTKEDHYNITGFTYTNNLSDGSSFKREGKTNTYSVTFYYTSNDYAIKFMNGGALDKTVTKQYQASIADVSYTPNRPTGVPASYIFSGWYDNELCVGDPYAFSGTMPANNITVYAKWSAPTFDVTVYLTFEGSDSQILKVPYGQKVDRDSMPTPTPVAGSTFLGWYTKDADGNLKPFNFDTLIYANLKLYPYWTSNSSFTVTYDADGGTGTVPTDSKTYAQDSAAKVLDGSGLTKNTNVFVYWKNAADSKIYYPGSYVPIGKANVVLKACYAPKSSLVSLTYHSNFGTDTTWTVDALLNNGRVALNSYASTGLPVRTGYEFVGWSLTAQSTTTYPAGTNVRVNSTGSNDVYAQWKQSTFAVSYVYTGTVPAGAPAVPTTDAQVVYNTDYTVKAAPTLAGYVFDGWYKDGAKVTSFTMPDQNVELTGSWSTRKDLSYTVYYYWNGTTESVIPAKTVTGQEFGATVTETPAAAAGVTPVATAAKSTTITAGDNQIIFYYYKNVTLTANSSTVEYDSLVHSVSGFTGAPTDADFSAVTVGATGTLAGTYPADFPASTVGTVDANAKYIVTSAVNGALTITPYDGQVVITAASDSKVYDGSALTNANYTVTNLKGNDAISAVITGTITDAGTVDNVVTSYEFTSGNASCYSNIVTSNGTLMVSKRSVTLTSATDSKVYDRQPLTNHNVTVSGSGFATGEGASYSVTGTRTVVGSSDNTFTYTLNTNTKPGNYTISQVTGKLIITPVTDEVTVTITENSGTEVYDGTAKTVTGYTVTSISDPLYTDNDFTFSGTDSVSGTDAGTYEMELEPGDFTNTSTNFTNVTFVIVDGALTITPRAVTMVSNTVSRAFNGQPLTDAVVTLTGSFVTGEVSNVRATGTITDVGSVTNTIEFTKESSFKAGNYTITKTEGVLTITAYTGSVAVVITGNTDTKVYNGNQHSVNGYVVESITDPLNLYTAADMTFTGTASASGTDAGSYPMGLTVAQFANNNSNYANVTFTVNDGLLTISRRPVTLTSESFNREYNGKPLTKPAVTIGGDGFVAGEVSDVHATGTITYVGTTPNLITYTENTGFKASNYDIDKVEGTLEITNCMTAIEIQSNSKTWLYDGAAHSDGGFTVTFGAETYTVAAGGEAILPTGDTVKAIISTSVTNVSDSGENSIDAIAVSHQDQYDTIDVSKGLLTILPRTVKLESATVEKVYDRMPLTAPAVDEKGDGFVDGEVSGLIATGKITDVGSVINTIAYTEEASFKAENYTVTKTEGTLTVKPVTDKVIVEIVGNNVTHLYDGKQHNFGGYTVSISDKRYTEKDFTANAPWVTGKDAGVYPLGLSDQSFTNKNLNFTNVIFRVKDGALTITPRKVAFYSGSAEKVYNGEPLTYEYVITKGDGFVAGEGATFTMTGTQTKVGSSFNTYDYKLKSNTKAQNYEIEQNFGSLTVKEYIPIPVPQAQGTVTTVGDCFD